jgi:ketopantoate reductase
VVILFSKTHDLASSIAASTSAIGSRTCVRTLLNGMRDMWEKVMLLSTIAGMTCGSVAPSKQITA